MRRSPRPRHGQGTISFRRSCRCSRSTPPRRPGTVRRHPGGDCRVHRSRRQVPSVGVLGQLRSSDEPAQPLPTGPVAQGGDMQPGEVLLPGAGICRPTATTASSIRATATSSSTARRRPVGVRHRRPTGVGIMQTDGNLVIYAPRRPAHLGVRHLAHPGTHLAVQDDGNTVIYRPDGTPAWETGTRVPLGPAARATTCSPARCSYPAGRSVGRRPLRFTYQTDGNLVLYGGRAHCGRRHRRDSHGCQHHAGRRQPRRLRPRRPLCLGHRHAQQPGKPAHRPRRRQRRHLPSRRHPDPGNSTDAP